MLNWPFRFCKLVAMLQTDGSLFLRERLLFSKFGLAQPCRSLRTHSQPKFTLCFREISSNLGRQLDCGGTGLNRVRSQRYTCCLSTMRLRIRRSGSCGGSGGLRFRANTRVTCSCLQRWGWLCWGGRATSGLRGLCCSLDKVYRVVLDWEGRPVSPREWPWAEYQFPVSALVNAHDNQIFQVCLQLLYS